MDIKFSGLDEMIITNTGGTAEQEILFQRFIKMLMSKQAVLEHSATYNVGTNNAGGYSNLSIRLKELPVADPWTSYNAGKNAETQQHCSDTPIWIEQGFASHASWKQSLKDAGYDDVIVDSQDRDE